MKLPGIDWQKRIGTDMIGAEFGLVVKNILDFNIGPTKGHVKVDVDDQIYARGLLGIIGERFDFIDAGICFKGGINYEMNILQDFSFDGLVEQIEVWFQNVPRLINDLKIILQTFQRLFGHLAGTTPERTFQSIIDTLQNLPVTAKDMARQVGETWGKVAAYDNLPRFIEEARQVILRANAVFSEVKIGATDLFNANVITEILWSYTRPDESVLGVADSAITVLPWAAEQILQGVETIVREVPKLIKSPQTTMANIAKAVYKIYKAVMALINIKDLTDEVFLFKEGKQPFLFEVGTEIQALLDDFTRVNELFKREAPDWIEGLGEHTEGVLENAFGSLKSTKRELVGTMNEALEELQAPLKTIGNLAGPLLEAYSATFGTIKAVKRHFESLKKGFETVQGKMHKIFGPKTSLKFPKKKLDPKTCGGGFYPSFGVNTKRYVSRGIDLVLQTGQEVVAPFAGEVTSITPQSIAIATTELQGMEAIVEGISLANSIKLGQRIDKGDTIGTARSTGCQTNTIHFAIRGKGSSNYVDPTKYVPSPGMMDVNEQPRWIQKCDSYWLTFMDKSIDRGTLTGGPQETEETPTAPKTGLSKRESTRSLPVSSDLELLSGQRHVRRDITQSLRGNTDLLRMLGLGDVKDVTEHLSLKLQNIKVSIILSILDRVGRGNELRNILNILELCHGSCKLADSLTDEQLRWELKKSGKSTTGTRHFLLQRYTSSDIGCPSMFRHLNNLDSLHCRTQDNCLGVSCCLSIPVPPFHTLPVKASVSFDPCTMTLTMELGQLKETKKLSPPGFAEEDDYTYERSSTLLNSAKLLRSFRITREDSVVKVYLNVKVCAKGVCLRPMKIFNGVQISIPPCPSGGLTTPANRVNMMEMTLGDLEKEIFFFRPGSFRPDSNGLEIPVLDLEALPQRFSGIINGLRTAIKEELMDSIQMDMQDPGIELGVTDSYMKGTFPLGPWDKTFFNVRIEFLVGPIPMYLGFGAGGFIGVKLEAGLSLIKMTAYGQVTPGVGAIVSASLGIGTLLLSAELRLIGHVLTTDFPTRAEIAFSKFPLNVGARMDMIMIPLRLELRGLLVSGPFPPAGDEIKLLDYLLWHYETPPVTKNIFNTGIPEPDHTPPTFRKFKFDTSRSIKVGKRVAITTHCEVGQLAGRDVVEPAFQLEVAAEDDESQVKLTYNIGTYRGGSDVVNNEGLGGPSNVVFKKMKGGVPLYFTVTGTNSGGGDAKVTCELPTYDVTLPGGRVTPDFLTTSHPNILRASAVAHDDSVILHKREGVGYGRKVYGDQVVPWHDVSTTANTAVTATGPALQRFTGGRTGRVISTLIASLKLDIPQQCAMECLKHPPAKCLSFNYDYGHETCELLEEVEGHGVEMHEVGHFHNFERLGVGHAVEFRHEDVHMRHDALYYFNLYLNNTLGYVNILTSPGVLTDFTPPSPGPLENVIMDVLMTEDCGDFVLDHWEQFKCGEQTPMPNHRHHSFSLCKTWIVDGEGSRTVFNGHEPLVDMRYTRANRYVSANWDGFHDNETGLHGYSWTSGRAPCGGDVHPHIDPHAHLFDVSEWTHDGIASPLNLEDGEYHITVRAINNVEFGGAMATTVCHTTPYIIDNTPPFVHDVHSVQYDETDFTISAEYNVSDPLSDIREIDFGLGRSKRDVHMMDWYRHGNTTHTSVIFHIPDGVPAWVKVRAINNVDLREIDHADQPVLVDTSPPIAGILYDGSVHGHDLNFNTICANWKDFHDEESGLSHYEWGVGSEPGTDDVVPLTEYPHTASQACADVQLIHNTTYYSMLVALNNGHDNLNVSTSSDGVLFDATPPVEGSLRDGLEPDSDLQFSSEPSTVSANWDGYSDPESGIGDYAVTVQRTSSFGGNRTHSQEIIHEKTSTGPDATQINWHKFHLHHGDHVSVHLDATNQAIDSTVTSSDGFVIDLTKPVMVHLGDGAEPGEDRAFSADASRISANWIFEDAESGIEKYMITVYTKAAGTKRQIYPEREQNVEIDGNQNKWTSPAHLNLINGALYYVRVAAVNGAGAATVHETNGVIVDTSPPGMVNVRVGVTAGEPEELEDGYVLHTDLQGIQASWMATDFESGVVSYWVTVGTTPGDNDVRDYQSLGPETDGYVGNLNLQLTNKTTNSPVYYLTVKAENAAGSFSTNITSSPIKVVRADQVGTVTDGWETWSTIEQAMVVDVDYQRDASTVTVQITVIIVFYCFPQFSGFESEQHGISHYEWSVGTEPRLDDVQPYTAAGIVLSEHTDNPGEGLSSHGQAQSLLPLSPGVQLYATVRAITGAGNVLDFSTDGFTVDITPPVIQIDSVGVQIGNSSLELDWERSHYQKSADSISANWHVIESKNALAYSWFCYGSYPGACDIYPVTNTTDMSVPNSLVKPIRDGAPNILTVSAINVVGLRGQTMSGRLTVDETPPVAGEVFCPQFVQDASELSCRWHGFYDTESNIQYYMFGVGLAEGDDSIFNFTRIPSHQTHYSPRGITVTHEATYYVTVVGYNPVEDSQTAYSAPIMIDTTPPIAGRVIELSRTDEVNETSKAGESMVACTSKQECDSLGVKCQTSLTQVAVAWEPFRDPESPIARCEVALGTTAGGGQLQDFTAVTPGQNFVIITGLDLTYARQVFSTVRGTNAAGMSAVSTSNGVYISRVSSGLSPLGEIRVWDGEYPSKDLDYQAHNEELSAHWDFTGDPCPISKYEWSIMKVDGTVIQPSTAVPRGQTSGNNNELQMHDGETFFVAVRATNEMDFTYTVRSDGITVMLEPLIPGEVRDGGIVGYDLNLQPSITTLSANWDSFGDRRHQGQHDEDKEQAIEYYEVALGTDRRFPRTRNNVHPYVNVGLNRTYTFEYLQLIPKVATYYITVRAHSVSTSVAEVTSNGIQVGYGGQVLSVGHVNVNSFIPSTEEMSFSWVGFAFALPVLYSQWGVGSLDGNLTHIECKKLQTCEIQETEECISLMDRFDIHPLTNVGRDTAVEAADLELIHNETYTVVVIVTDQSAECSLASSFVTSVSYSSRTDELHVSWADFSDPESGIDHYEIAVFSGAACSADSDERFQETDFVPVLFNDTEYTVTDIALEPGIPYFVRLLTFNKAGLSIMTESSPILLDLEDPVGGTVKDGLDFSSDVSHQSSTTTMEGTFIYLPTHGGDKCPSRQFLMEGEEDGWSPVSSVSIYGLLTDHRILFTPDEVTFDGENGLSITMSRDVQQTRMYSGAYSTRADMQGGGSYTFDMIAASGDIKAVTSVVFWDGPAGVVGDLDVPVEQWAQEEAATEPPDCTCCLINNTGDLTNYTGALTNNIENLTKSTTAPGGHEECLCNCTHYQLENSTAIRTSAIPVPTVDYELVGGDIVLSGGHVPYRGCGLQVHPGVVAAGLVGHYAVLWCRFANDTVKPLQEMTALDFDPTDGWHTYELRITAERTFAVGEDWNLELIIDGRSLAIMNGIPVFSEQAQLTLAVWNRGDFVPAVHDVFSSPEGSAFFRDLRFPPSADNMCRFGDPFRPGDNSVSVFYAGVGTEKLKDDVSPFHEVARPCVPCVDPCDKFACDSECFSLVPSVFHVRIDNLTLSPNVSFKQLDGVNVTDGAAVYYITVKAVSGSGRLLLSSSNGVNIDVTPPDIQEIYHVDMSWDDEEISKFQGSNSTIAVRYKAFDRESQVVEYYWAIGTTPRGTDIQPYRSNGLKDIAVNSDLKGFLHHGSTYYVTLKAVNGAGLQSVVTSSGVKVLFGYPDVAHTNSTVPFGEDLPDDVFVDDTVMVTDLTYAGLSWESPREEEGITAIFFSLSSDAYGINDVLPPSRVGAGDSGSVIIANGTIQTHGKVSNISDLQRNREDENPKSNEFHMEPGRTLYPTLRACNGAHHCTPINVKNIIYIRPCDRLGTSHHDDGAEIVLKRQASETISIRTMKALRNGTTLVAGLLSEEDVSTKYTSDASVDFKSFVANPDFTAGFTDRWLRHRVKHWFGVSFFVTTLGNVEIPGPINITVPINTTQIDPGLEPRLLYWNYEIQEWQDAQKTCDRGELAQSMVDWSDRYAHFQVCKTNANNIERGSEQTRAHRGADDTDRIFQGPAHFALAAVEKSFSNSRPVIVSHSRVQAQEDEEKAIWIRYFDLDGDRLSFSISVPPLFGSVQLQEEEEYAVVYYNPCLDCYGTDKFNISAVEMLPVNMDPHIINIELVVEVEPRNDDPVLFVLVEDDPALILPTKRLDLTVEVNRVSNMHYRDLQVVVGSYDVETADTVTLHFSAESNDTVSTSQQERRVELVPACTTNSTWFSVILEHGRNDTSGRLQLDPCEIQSPHPVQEMAWVFTTLTYRPHINFTGKDVIKINAKDQHGGLSRVVTLDLYVLENLCQHGGECVGDTTDPDCTSKDRADGFDGYWCNCSSAPGWSGRLCQTDYDECLSTPCPSNYTCIDQVNGYVCECGNPSWPCAGYLEDWEICLIVLAVVILLLLAIVFLRRWKKPSYSVKKAGSMFLGRARVSPATTLIKVKPVHGVSGDDDDVKPSGPDCVTVAGRDRPVSCKVRSAWDDDDTLDRRAAALLNWEWNPKSNAETRHRPIGVLAGAVTELRPLRGTLVKKIDP
ncbi:HEG1 [Branchiostoma lanceolatum]|uniref:HEG1 protein n=1 Tax=Branchiostoma lanceolatum TaxID=7740 RepID=A0A8J9W4D8_BRALA|nr:HEG1 [Branchiostoma lanceolatum]